MNLTGHLYNRHTLLDIYNSQTFNLINRHNASYIAIGQFEIKFLLTDIFIHPRDVLENAVIIKNI